MSHKVGTFEKIRTEQTCGYRASFQGPLRREFWENVYFWYSMARDRENIRSYPRSSNLMWILKFLSRTEQTSLLCKVDFGLDDRGVCIEQKRLKHIEIRDRGQLRTWIASFWIFHREENSHSAYQGHLLEARKKSRHWALCRCLWSGDRDLCREYRCFFEAWREKDAEYCWCI